MVMPIVCPFCQKVFVLKLEPLMACPRCSAPTHEILRAIRKSLEQTKTPQKGGVFLWFHRLTYVNRIAFIEFSHGLSYVNLTLESPM